METLEEIRSLEAVELLFKGKHIPEGTRQKILSRAAACQKLSPFEAARERADGYNRKPGNLAGYDCPECLNRGDFLEIRGDETRFEEVYVPCKCTVTRRNLRYIRWSGLADLLERDTFDTWQTPEKWQQYIKNRALAYAAHPEGWFYIGGRPGTGKTHLCTAICGELMRKGYECRYVLWREFARKAKASVNELEAYEDLVNPLRAVPVLYIDDFFKTGRKRDQRSGEWQDMTPTEGDINLAFDILGHRYNRGNGNITIISSELSVERLMGIDEAVASRVYQNAKENVFNWSEMENWRV